MDRDYKQGFRDGVASVGWRRKPLPTIEFHQNDWVPAFAAFSPDQTEADKAFCVLNVGAFLQCLENNDVTQEELPYFIAESMMHEVIHVLEQWAGVEFNEDRVEALLDKYRAAIPTSDD